MTAEGTGRGWPGLIDRAILAVTGLTGIVIGATAVTSVRAFYAANGVDIGHSAAALSEARGAAGAVPLACSSCIATARSIDALGPSE